MRPCSMCMLLEYLERWMDAELTKNANKASQVTVHPCLKTHLPQRAAAIHGKCLRMLREKKTPRQDLDK